MGVSESAAETEHLVRGRGRDVDSWTLGLSDGSVSDVVSCSQRGSEGLTCGKGDERRQRPTIQHMHVRLIPSSPQGPPPLVRSTSRSSEITNSI